MENGTFSNVAKDKRKKNQHREQLFIFKFRGKYGPGMCDIREKRQISSKKTPVISVKQIDIERRAEDEGRNCEGEGEHESRKRKDRGAEDKRHAAMLCCV
jgi:predicted transposase YbfD/YdcC